MTHVEQPYAFQAMQASGHRHETSKFIQIIAIRTHTHKHASAYTLTVKRCGVRTANFVSGADSVEKYWLAQSEVTKENYDSLYKLWNTLVPLYQKLRQFLASSIAKKLGSDVFTDPKRVAVHLLGMLFFLLIPTRALLTPIQKWKTLVRLAYQKAHFICERSINSKI